MMIDIILLIVYNTISIINKSYISGVSRIYTYHTLHILNPKIQYTKSMYKNTNIVFSLRWNCDAPRPI
jgi:hypothetical protein